ncbi:MAG: SMC-Scp complex subunit ScpB [Thermoanaerobaculales bacterium]
MDNDLLCSLVEAIVLTAGAPVAASAIAEALEDPEVGEVRVTELLDRLAKAWDGPDRGIRLERVAGGWRPVTVPMLDPYLRAYHGVAARQRLSQAALEVLSIIAHRQPVTLPEINFIRGANSAGVVRNLLERKLLRMAGRKKVVGKPFLYRTTKEFLLHFGLERAEDLPDPEEFVKDETAPAD